MRRLLQFLALCVLLSCSKAPSGPWERLPDPGFTSRPEQQIFMAQHGGAVYLATVAMDAVPVHGKPEPDYETKVLRFTETGWEPAVQGAEHVKNIRGFFAADGGLYIDSGKEVLRFEGGQWKKVADLPRKLIRGSHLTASAGKLYLTNSEAEEPKKRYRGAHVFEGGKWKRLGQRAFSTTEAWHGRIAVHNGVPYVAANEEAAVTGLYELKGDRWERTAELAPRRSGGLGGFQTTQFTLTSEGDKIVGCISVPEPIDGLAVYDLSASPPSELGPKMERWSGPYAIALKGDTVFVARSHGVKEGEKWQRRIGVQALSDGKWTEVGGAFVDTRKRSGLYGLTVTEQHCYFAYFLHTDEELGVSEIRVVRAKL